MNTAAAIDKASELGDMNELKRLLQDCQKHVSEKSEQAAIYYFYEANCHNALAREKNDDLSWKQDEKVSEILALRKAISDQSFSNLSPIAKAKIYTNLANGLNRLGRITEAIKFWNSALSLYSNFAMALGNKAIGLQYYGYNLYDQGHAAVMTAFSKELLCQSLDSRAIWDSGEDPEAINIFKSKLDTAESCLKEIQYDQNYNLNQWPLGDDPEEIDYRKWCLNKGLFLSPLNDACTLSVAAQDIIHLPTHSYNIDEKQRFPNYFNIIKHEYVSARFMLYQAVCSDYIVEEKHYSDNLVLLSYGDDASFFNYKMELLKASYRIAYSLFDKIALFINDYFSIGMKVDNVSFRKIWACKKNNKFILNPIFENSNNWPLRGLYYLSKDLFDNRFIDTALPEAQELAQLRNNLEHRFVSLQSYNSNEEKSDELLYIEFSDLENKAILIFSMVREAIIYLSLAMYREESFRNNN